jgi:YD repeat-containing protein
MEIQDIISDFTPSSIVSGSLKFDSRYKNAIRYDAFDRYSNAVQYTPRDGSSISLIWDHHGQLPVAEVKGASNSNIAYTSFEADGTGGWQLSGTVLHAGGITGVNSFNGQLQRSVNAGNYIVTAWAASGAGITVNGSSGVQRYSKGGWILYQWNLTNVTSVTVNSSNMDEVRLYPKGAQMTSYTYTPNIGINTICSPAGRISYYEYDGYQRLQLVRDQDGNIIKTASYQYNNKLPLQ